MTFHSVGNGIIIPSDELHHFSRGVGIPPTSEDHQPSLTIINHQPDHVLVKSEHDLERDERSFSMESTWPVFMGWPCREWPTRRIEPVPHCSMPILFAHVGYMTAILLPHNCGGTHKKPSVDDVTMFAEILYEYS